MLKKKNSVVRSSWLQLHSSRHALNRILQSKYLEGRQKKFFFLSSYDTTIT